MTWEYEYSTESDETTIYWGGEQQGKVQGKITRWRNGYPDGDAAREAVAEAIQDAGTPERIRMQYDFNYGFSERSDDNS